MLNRIKVAGPVLEGKTVLTILCSNGDDRVICDVLEPKQKRATFEKFDTMMDGGYVAFGFDAKGNQVEQINKRQWKEKKAKRQGSKTLFAEPREFQMVAPVAGG